MEGSVARDDERMTRFDALAWAAASSDKPSLPTLQRLVALASPKQGQHVQIAVETIIVDHADPFEVVRPRSTAVVVRRVGLVSLMRVADELGPFVLSVWPTAYDGVFHLVGSVPTTDPRWRKTERWVGKAGPAVTPCFLNHADFADVGTALSEFGHVEVSRLTARKRRDSSSLTRGWPARAGGRPRPTHDEAIADAAAEGASVRTLTLSVPDVLSLHVRRLAGATYYSGDFAAFEDVVLGRLARAAAARRQLLSDRERRIDSPPLAPISVRLSSPLLVDAEATGEVLSELEHQRDTAVAVLHRNPYLHVVVTDYQDGSNFDVFVTTADTIDIYPGFRASLGALGRLTQRLSDRFEALEITEAPPPEPVSLDELLAD
jgi:hypothetical protein